MHQQFINIILEKSKFFPNISFIGLAGNREFDEYSDIDIVIGYDGEIDKHQLINSLGKLISPPLTGYHVGEPRLEICMFLVNNSILQVDIKFVKTVDIPDRYDDYEILYTKNSKILENSKSKVSIIDEAVINLKFYKWLHYGAAKTKRGELLTGHNCLSNCIELISSLLHKNKLDRKLRRIEINHPKLANYFLNILKAQTQNEILSSYLKLYFIYQTIATENNELLLKDSVFDYLTELHPNITTKFKIINPTVEYELKHRQYISSLDNVVPFGFNVVDEYSKFLSNDQFEFHLNNKNYYVIDKKDNLIGFINIRTELKSQKDIETIGHIGYSINPKYYNNDFAKQVLFLAIEKCHELKISPIYVNVDCDNIKSINTIIKNEFKFIRKNDSKYIFVYNKKDHSI